jgi:large subunit ribosomal protein L28
MAGHAGREPALPGDRRLRFARGAPGRLSFNTGLGSARPVVFFPRSHKGAFGVASVCDICGKGPGFGNSVSRSHRRTPRRFNPNIQTVRAKVDGTPRRLHVCTSCIKAGKVTR